MIKIALLALSSVVIAACAPFNPLAYLKNLDLLAFARSDENVAPEYRHRLHLARESFNKGLYGITIAHLEAELAARPHSVAALNGIGASYDQMGRHDIALQYYFIALDYEPGSASTLANIGYSYLLQERPGEAIALFELALQNDPQNPVAAGNLAAARNFAPTHEVSPELLSNVAK